MSDTMFPEPMDQMDRAQNQLVDCPACNLGNPGVYMKDGRMVCPHTPKAAHRDDCIAKSIGGPCNADCE